MDDLSCWKCGADLCAKNNAVPQPFGRSAECPACHARLHVCRMCRHFDTAKAKQCREPMAEPVQDKTRANFCDWFQPRPNRQTPAQADATHTPSGGKSALDALFGGGQAASTPAPDSRKALDDLFG